MAEKRHAMHAEELMFLFAGTLQNWDIFIRGA